MCPEYNLITISTTSELVITRVDFSERENASSVFNAIFSRQLQTTALFERTFQIDQSTANRCRFVAAFAMLINFGMRATRSRVESASKRLRRGNVRFVST